MYERMMKDRSALHTPTMQVVKMTSIGSEHEHSTMTVSNVKLDDGVVTSDGLDIKDEVGDNYIRLGKVNM